MEEVDTAAQRILDPVPARVARNDLPSGLFDVVGQEECGLVAPQAGDCNLSQSPLVVGDANGLLKVPDAPMSAVRSVDHCASPCGIWLVGQTAEDSAAPPSDGDERCLAAGVE